MRVIAGKARSLQLKTPPGFYTRPTMIYRKTLFNIFNLDLLDATFWIYMQEAVLLYRGVI